jgi:hypothetical protein
VTVSFSRKNPQHGLCYEILQDYDVFSPRRKGVCVYFSVVSAGGRSGGGGGGNSFRSFNISRAL